MSIIYELFSKKMEILKACTFCAKRKIKCDPQQRPCTNCIQYGLETECKPQSAKLLYHRACKPCKRLKTKCIKVSHHDSALCKSCIRRGMEDQCKPYNPSELGLRRAKHTPIRQISRDETVVLQEPPIFMHVLTNFSIVETIVTNCSPLLLADRLKMMTTSDFRYFFQVFSTFLPPKALYKLYSRIVSIVLDLGLLSMEDSVSMLQRLQTLMLDWEKFPKGCANPLQLSSEPFSLSLSGQKIRDRMTGKFKYAYAVQADLKSVDMIDEMFPMGLMISLIRISDKGCQYVRNIAAKAMLGLDSDEFREVIEKRRIRDLSWIQEKLHKEPVADNLEARLYGEESSWIHLSRLSTQCLTLTTEE